MEGGGDDRGRIMSFKESRHVTFPISARGRGRKGTAGRILVTHLGRVVLVQRGELQKIRSKEQRCQPHHGTSM